MNLVLNSDTSSGESPLMPLHPSSRQDYLGETALHKAARAGSVPGGRVLAGDGRTLPHLLNTSGQTPARLAAVCGHPEMAAWLTEYQSGAELPGRGEWGDQDGTVSWQGDVMRCRSVI